MVPDTLDTNRQPSPWSRIWFAACLLISIVAVASYVANDQAWRQDSRKATEVSNATIASLQTTVSDLQYKNQTLSAEAAHPTLGTWNSCRAACTIGPDHFREGTVPDTFTYHLRFHSDVLVYYAFLTLPEFARWNDCPGSVYSTDRAVNRLVAGCVNYWLFNNNAPQDRTGEGQDVNFDFHLSEGCADYVSVLMPFYANQTATISPNVGVTYNPATVSTGICAGQ
jgi:hypothetical protein